ncbi:MAG TPA: hypothetical protein PLL00_12135 [Bacteroidia bacterium]|jgi:hypothetical protein|nr:hypothetical protein [Bacteroidia bacterium]
MKRILTLSICLTIGIKLFSQEVKIKEPEFTGMIILVSGGDTFEKLEKQKASAASKADIGAALFGVVKGEGMNIVNGALSPVRVKASKTIKFIAKVKENDKDPVEVINIFKLEQDKIKDKRVLIVNKVNLNQSSSEIKFIKFEASKYGTSSYLIEISNLPGGEYAMTLEDSRGVFNMFGVDEVQNMN